MSATALAPPPPLLKLLAHDLRWRVVEALCHGDQRVQELAALVGQPYNVLSYHLRQLREHSLVSERRSAADGRDVYYSVDLDRLQEGYRALGESLHPAMAPTTAPNKDGVTSREQRVRVLFLCTHNSARSQMAEGLFRHLAPDRVEVHSAGTVATRVHPLAIAAMDERGIDIRGQRSKTMDELVGEDFDYVVTVCDNARESCPIFPGAPERIHWSIPDPSAVDGDEATRLRAFRGAADELSTRLRYLLAQIERGRS